MKITKAKLLGIGIGLSLGAIAGGLAGAWSWLMYKRNKVGK